MAKLCSTWVFGVLVIVGSIATARAQTNHVATTSTTPLITPVQLAEWQRIVDTQHGVSGIDPAGHKIGPNIAKRSGLGLNWYPVDIYKQTLCGTLHHFNFYDGYGDEGDWNNFIIPAASHSYLLEDVRPIADADDLHQCSQPGDCLEAEITPDENFYENPWFPKSAGASVLEGRGICTYGPWVWEEAHGNRPEIHPSELYWWKDSAPGLETYTLMVVQDDSNRFDRPGNYNGTIVRPWSKVPRTAEFKIPFEVSLPQVTPNLVLPLYEIDELALRNVVTADDATARRDSDNGKDHAIQFDGRIVLRANELQSNDNNIGVRFVELTRGSRSGGPGLPRSVLRGYIAITSKIGLDDRGKEGYHVIRVRSRGVSTQAPLEASTAAQPESIPSPLIIKPLRKSLRVAVVDGEPRLTGDVEVRRTAGEVLGTRAGVSGLGGNTTEIQTGSGPVKVTLPVVTLAPIIGSVKLETVSDAPADWQAMVKAAGSAAEIPVLSTSARARKVHQLRLEVAPFYAPARDGKPSREDDSPFVEELNEAIEKKDASRTRELFGGNRPIAEANWKFAAKNLNTGEPISVRIGNPVANEIAVRVLSGLEPNAGIMISFPPELGSSVIELTASVEMTDALKNKGVFTRRVWSHSLGSVNKVQLVNEAVSIAARMAGVDVGRLVGASKITGLPANDIVVKQPFTRCARTVRLYAGRAAQDENVDIGELNRLRALVDHCKTRL